MTITFFIILNKIGNITIEIFDYELNQVYKKKKKNQAIILAENNRALKAFILLTTASS